MSKVRAMEKGRERITLKSCFEIRKKLSSKLRRVSTFIFFRSVSSIRLNILEKLVRVAQNLHDQGDIAKDVRTCKTELTKHVFPTFCKPARRDPERNAGCMLLDPSVGSGVRPPFTMANRTNVRVFGSGE